MKTKLSWKSGMNFVSETRGHESVLDATLEGGGLNLGANPKEFVLQGLSGCTAMDVIFYLKKYKLEPLSFEIFTEADLTEKLMPTRFKEVRVHYKLLGDNLLADKVISAVEKSMTKYCGVTYMISRTCPVKYKLELNGEVILESVAKFD